MKSMKSTLLFTLFAVSTMVCFASTSHAKKESPHQSGSYVSSGGTGFVIEQPMSPAFDIQLAEVSIEYFDATPSIRLVEYRFKNVAISGAKGKTHPGFPSETLARARTFDC